MKFELVRNDITNMCVDAVVCPSNELLMEGSGTAKAIYKKAGEEELKAACKAIAKKAKKGIALPTEAFGLDAKYILHAVVPKWRGGKHDEYVLLSSVYYSALQMADRMNCESIAFPLLGGGNNGFDKELAYELAKEAIENYEANNTLNKVYLVIYDTESMDLMRELGVTVTEYVDEVYVLAKDESHNHVTETVKEAIKFLEEPENIENILEKWKKVVNTVLKVKGYLDKLKKKK